MNEALEQRKAAIEARYKEVTDELRRLEGEHRLVVDLMNKESEAPKRIRRKVEVVEDAPTE